MSSRTAFIAITFSVVDAFKDASKDVSYIGFALGIIRIAGFASRG